MKRHSYSDWLSVTLIELRAVSAALTQARHEAKGIHDLKRKADDDYYAGDCFNREKPARAIWRRAHLIQARARCSVKFYAQRELIRQLRGIRRLLEHDIEVAIAKHYARRARRWEAKNLCEWEVKVFSGWLENDLRSDHELLASALRGGFLPPPHQEIPWLHKFTAVLDLHT